MDNNNNFKVPFLPGLKRKREDGESSSGSNKMQNIDSCGDIFPSKLTIKFENFLILNSLILNQRVIVKNIIPFLSFVIFRQYLKIYYKKLDMNQTLTDHLSYMLNSSSSSAEGSFSSTKKTISKEKLIKRLDKPISLANKKNADVRIGYRWHSIFFVKFMFTFGIRKTEADEIHLLQSDGPLLFYRKKNSKEPANLKSLDFLNNDDTYDQYTLMPGNIYVVKANVYYAIVALQKCKIALNRCRKEFVKILNARNIPWYDPRDPDRVTRPSYVHPPPTPSLDRDAEWEPPDSDEEEPNNTNEVPILYYFDLNSDFNSQTIEQQQSVEQQQQPGLCEFEAPEQQQQQSVNENDLRTEVQQSPTTPMQSEVPQSNDDWASPMQQSPTTPMQSEVPQTYDDWASAIKLMQPQSSPTTEVPQSFENLIWASRMQPEVEESSSATTQQPEVPQTYDDWESAIKLMQPQLSSPTTLMQSEVPQSFENLICASRMQPEVEESSSATTQQQQQSILDDLQSLTLLAKELQQQQQRTESVIRYAPPAATSSLSRLSDGEDIDDYLLKFFDM